MIDRDLIKHGAEFQRAIANHKYEMTDQGIYFAEARAFGSGEYFFDTNGLDHGSTPNLITTQGFNHLLDVALHGQAAQPAFYLAIFSGAYTPVDGLTAATFPAAASEITSATTGYAEATRQVWTPTGPAADGAIANVSDTEDNKATFTIKTADTLTIRGAALLSEQVKGATSGVLLSISRFKGSGGQLVDRIHYNNDAFNLGYRVSLRPE